MELLKKLKQVFARKDPRGATINVDLVEQKIQKLITRGNAAEDGGQFGEALALYELAVSKNEAKASSHLNVGNALQKLGRHTDAITAYQKALALQLGYASARYNMGNSYAALGSRDEAIDAYGDAAQFNPQFADAHIALANAYHESGRFQEAVFAFQKALALKPDFAEVQESLAVTYLELKQFDRAIESFERALESNPESSSAHIRLAGVLVGLGRITQASGHCLQAMQFGAKDVGITMTAGNIFRQLGDLDNAERAFRQTVASALHNAVAHTNLGCVLADKTQYQQAILSYQRAIELDPRFALAYSNLGTAFGMTGQVEEAISATKHSLKINPKQPQCHNNLGVYLKDSGRMDEALVHFHKALEIESGYFQAYSNYLFCICHAVSMTPEKLYAEHCDFNRRFAMGTPTYSHSPDGTRVNQRLRLGFVSADFRSHALMNFFRPIFLQLVHRDIFDINLYYCHGFEDETTLALKSQCKKWTSAVSMDDAKLAQVIYADKVDILIDLSGHTGQNRLLAFARKPAPIQASWIGYAGTTGLEAMDYFIADRHFLPIGQFDNQFTEKIVYLPAGATFEPSAGAPTVNRLPALSNGYVTFGSFNRADKIHRAVVDVWSEILKMFPLAKMLIGGVNSQRTQCLLQEWFLDNHIIPERLIFKNRCSTADYMQLHHQIDLCLDTFPYCGATTSANALWMGVPTLTLRGKTPSGRPGACFLSFVGLEDEFASDDMQEVFQKAVHWTSNLEALDAIRQSVRGRFAKTFLRDPQAIAEGLEIALFKMHDTWSAGSKPASFEVTLRDIESSHKSRE